MYIYIWSIFNKQTYSYLDLCRFSPTIWKTIWEISIFLIPKYKEPSKQPRWRERWGMLLDALSEMNILWASSDDVSIIREVGLGFNWLFFYSHG